jgi:hypothetical protein
MLAFPRRGPGPIARQVDVPHRARQQFAAFSSGSSRPTATAAVAMTANTGPVDVGLVETSSAARGSSRSSSFGSVTRAG